MNKFPFSRLFCQVAAAASVLVYPFASQAHEIWVEEAEEGKLMIRFAEYGDDFEESPGHLDGIYPVVAWTLDDEGKPKEIQAEKKQDGYLLVDAKADKPVLVETGYIVMQRGEGPPRKPYFYARWYQPSFGAAKPALIFDIVPTGNAGEVQVYFRGKPLPEADVTLITPDNKEKELKTDKDGKVSFTPEVSGNYLLHCKHRREDLAGFASGAAYDQISHNCSLIWKQP